MRTTQRRYDIDWLRVIAIALLLIYHVAIGFQVWGVMIGFIAKDKPWASLWIPMAMLNVWRIPLLFFVSGMGVYFAIQRRNWKGLLLERANRILLPFVFGIFCIVPVSVYLWQGYYHIDHHYTYHPGHLWFLGNISAYVVILSPLFFFLKHKTNSWLTRGLRRLLSHPLGLVPVICSFMAEAIMLDPRPYELYATTWHGFVLGLLAFFWGFCFVLAGDSFWTMIFKWRWLFLGVAITLYLLRVTQMHQFQANYMIAIESNNWIFTILAFGYKYLNRPSKVLGYLSAAAYPVYIIHMIFLFIASSLVFPLPINAPIQFTIIVFLTFAGCFLFYEFIIRRVVFLRPFFGLKKK